MQDILPDGVPLCVLSQLSPRSCAPCAASCHEMAALTENLSESRLLTYQPCMAVHSQVNRLLGGSTARGRLLWRSQALKRAEEMVMIQTIGNRAIAMHPWIAGACIDGSDVFAACKRALLLSGDPATVTDEVERWMVCMIEAVEHNTFEASIPIWVYFAEQHLFDLDHTYWLLQLAHSLEAVLKVAPILKSCPSIVHQVRTIADILHADASAGKYSKHHSRLKEKDLRRLLSSSESHNPVADVATDDTAMWLGVSVPVDDRTNSPFWRRFGSTLDGNDIGAVMTPAPVDDIPISVMLRSRRYNNASTGYS